MPRKREEAIRRESVETTTSSSGSSRKSSAELESRKSSKEEVGMFKKNKSKGSLGDAGSFPAAPSSLFSFLSSDKSTSERRRQSMVKGESTESLDRREVARVRRQSPSPLPKHKPLVASRLSGGGTDAIKVSGGGGGGGVKVEVKKGPTIEAGNTEI